MQNQTALLRAAVAAAAIMGALNAQAPAVKNAEEVYKNIVQLKGTPADQLMPAMQFISTSLGVECTFCHVQGNMEADDKAAKKTAREMMAMTANINKEAFKGQRQVTCYSCHHGVGHPVAMPPVLESDLAARPASAPAPVAPSGATPAPQVTADQILEKYVAALGGADALKKVTTRVMTGATIVNGSETPIEIFTKAPNRRVSISSGSSYTAFDGALSWMGSKGRPARELSVSESDGGSIDAEFSLALRMKEIFPQLRRGRPETIGGVECEVLTGTRPGKTPVRMYFDKNSGLLLRLIRYAETPVGRNPTQLDYSDYREVDGVKSPWRWTLSRPNGRFTIQLKEAKNNVPIDDAKFVRPSGDVQ
ncbi:MAG: c-type cytochrome [Candidatus Solibacter sp.]